jgi:site-specific DNA-methyltransferase (adenine-specific)
MTSLLLDTALKMDGLKFLREIPDNYTPLVIFDPQYRGVLDKLAYGNEGARQKGRAALPQMTTDTISNFAREIARILKPSGHCFLWMDKFHLCTGDLRRIFERNGDGNLGMQVVDMLTWSKGRIGMGYRTRGMGEYMLTIQKQPIRAKGVWTDHGIPDVWIEKVADRTHVHEKPTMLVRRLIRAVTKSGDIVVNPCAGSFGTMAAALATGRHFLGCDINGPLRAP